MFIHSIFIVKPSDQNILYGRHFAEEANSEASDEWQEALYNATATTWTQLRPEEHLIAVINNKFVVYTLVGEVLIFVAGQENNADELGLSEVLQAIVNVLNELGKKKGKLVTEEGILSQYAKVCMSLNTIVQAGERRAQKGVVNLLDVEEIRGTVNMKPEEVRAKKLQREQKELKKLPRPPPPAFVLLDCFEKQNAAKSQPEQP